MNQELIDIAVPEEYNFERIDRFLVHALELDLSRSYIQKLIKQDSILVNGEPVKQNYKVKTDDSVTVNIPEPEVLELSPQNIDINIIYEDEYIAVINKQPGLVVHPGPGNWDHTLVNALLFHLKGLSSIGGVERPGIVHRLDKDTSGLMVIAKNDTAHRHLVNAFADRKVRKRYAAIVVGKPRKEHDIIELPIARHRKYRHKMTVDERGKEAVTEYSLDRIWNSHYGLYSLLDITLHTGRTHQIRVHLSSMGNPIVGDPVYSKKWEKYRVPWLLLVSKYLAFDHPEDGRPMEFEAPLPEHFEGYINRLESMPLSGK